MSTKKHIPYSDWQERLQVFSFSNQGRIASIASEGLRVIENKRLRNVKYYPQNKEEEMVITLYDELETFRHQINTPSEIYIHENKEGKALILEVVDHMSNPTYIRLFQ